MDLSSDSHVVMGEYCLDLLPVIVGDLKPQMVWTSVFLYIISDSFVIRTFLFGISRLVCNRNEVSYGCIIRWTTLFPRWTSSPYLSKTIYPHIDSITWTRVGNIRTTSYSFDIHTFNACLCMTYFLLLNSEVQW